MEKTIKINLKECTCDIEIRNFPLGKISQLSTISDDVADNFKKTLILLGVNEELATQATERLVQETTGIQRILEVCLRGT